MKNMITPSQCPTFGASTPTDAQPVAMNTSFPTFGVAPVKSDVIQLPIIIGVDCEYHQVSETENVLLSVQFYLIANEHKHCKLFMKVEDNKRPRFKNCLQKLVRKAIQEKAIDNWPTKIIVCGHFLRADLLHFANAFSDFEDKLTAVRKTIVSMEDKYGIDVKLTPRERERLAKTKAETQDAEKQKMCYESFNLYDESRHYHPVDVTFYDTYLLTPAGQALSDIGVLVGVPKVEIPEGHSISKMDVLLKKLPDVFEKYAMTDAEITAKFFLSYRQFCKAEGLKGLPYTIGGMALSLFKDSIGKSLPEYFGQEIVTKEIMNDKTGKFKTIKALVSTDDKIASEEFVKHTYHGGVNNCFQVGPTTIDTWTDIDAKSCYTTILSNIRTIDYAKAEMSKNLADYLKDIMGFARVRFKFPSDCKYPTLPVRTDKYGLVYPLEGVSWCTSHELIVANSTGAEIEVMQGFIIPWREDGEYVFRDFMRLVRSKRNQYKNTNVFYEKLWKEIGNSLYGKLAQGLRLTKTGYDIFLQYHKTLPPSAITNAYYASYVTGVARALMSEHILSISDNYDLVSVTTDGYCSNAPLDAVDISGPISQLFEESFYSMNGEPTKEEIAKDGFNPILEVKHQVQQVISMKTRGQLTALAIDEDKPLLAKAGTQTHIGKPNGDKGSKRDQNAEMVKLYLEREPGQLHLSKSLISIKDQFVHQSDLVGIEKKQRLNLEADFKRELYNPKMRQVGDVEHIHLDTKPFRTIEDMLFARTRFDEWRKTNCLKSLADWDNWCEYYAIQKAKKGTTLRLKESDDSGSLLLRLFLRAYMQRKLGLCGDEYSRKALVEKFAEWGYSYTTKDFTPAKKAKLFTHCVPRTTRVDLLMDHLKALFPKAKLDDLLV